MSGGEVAIGIDVGGTKIAAGLVEIATGRVLAMRRVPTEPERGGEAVLQTCLDLAGRLAEEALAAGTCLAGIGVGVPELVSPEGSITSNQTIDWRDVPVAEAFGRIAPAGVESDVRAAALAEARYGGGRERSSFLYVTIGTGISCTLVQGGLPYRGARGNALVLASGQLTCWCERCGGFAVTVVEEFSSGPAIARRYADLTGDSAATSEKVLGLAEAGDAIARAVVADAAELVGGAIGFAVNILDPEVVVIGGGLGTAGGTYWEHMVRSAREHIWSEQTRGLEILRSELGEHAGLIGAALVGWRAGRAHGVGHEEERWWARSS